MEATYDKPCIIFEYTCNNQRIGIADGHATISRLTPPSRILKIASNPFVESGWVREKARELCPFNQIQRVTCRVRAYLYVLGRKTTDGEFKTLYEGMMLV